MSLLISDPPRALEVHHLDFDTRLFGAQLGSVVRTGEAPVTPASLRTLLTEARREGYQHLIFRTGAEDFESIWAAEQSGMHLVDIGVDSTFTFGTTSVPEQPARPLVREARTSDIAPLQDLAA